MTKTEILERVRSTMAEMFELDPGAITPEARLIEDLDLDSIDAVDLAVSSTAIADTIAPAATRGYGRRSQSRSGVQTAAGALPPASRKSKAG